MRNRRLLITALAVAGLAAGAAPEPDGLATEIARWSAVVAAGTRTDPLWLDAKNNGEPLLALARDELRQGRRLVAIERLAAARQGLAAAMYAGDRPADERKNVAAFEAEWTRVGAAMRDVLSAGVRAQESLADIRPALVRALAEAALSQARQSYAASLEYGRNTEPQYGLYYLGAAQAQRSFLEFARRATTPAGPTPGLRPLGHEIDALQGELLAAYRPPASIDRHGEFIVASAAVKEARELDAAGYRYAALLRYLQAAQRTATFRSAAPQDRAAVLQRLHESAARLDGSVDHSLGRFFVERAHSALATAPGTAGDAVAEAIVMDVLPRYFSALEAARPSAPVQPARVTVTLVRWPFT